MKVASHRQRPAGPPIGSPYHDGSLDYLVPTAALVLQLFPSRFPEFDLLDSVRPPGVAAIRFTREVHFQTIVDRMVVRGAWATEGSVLTRDGEVVGFESCPCRLSDESRCQLEILPTLGVSVWIDRESWRSPGSGYRIRLTPMASFLTDDKRPVDEALAGLGLDPSRW